MAEQQEAANDFWERVNTFLDVNGHFKRRRENPHDLQTGIIDGMTLNFTQDARILIDAAVDTMLVGGSIADNYAAAKTNDEAKTNSGPYSAGLIFGRVVTVMDKRVGKTILLCRALLHRGTIEVVEGALEVIKPSIIKEESPLPMNGSLINALNHDIAPPAGILKATQHRNR